MTLHDTPHPASSASQQLPAAEAAVARRVVLSGLGLGALSVTVAACGSSGADSTAAAKRATKPAPTAGADGPSESASSSAGTADASSAAPPGGAALTSLSKIPQGGTVSVTDATGRKLLVTRTGADTVKAVSAKCTHAGCIVKAKGKDLVCPCHGSVFTPGTGAVQRGPATSPLPAVAVKVQGGSVVLAS